MKVLIITGGNSSERKISLISAKSVKQALEENGHEVRLFDFKKGLAPLRKMVKEFDIVFPVMHGKEGEDGVLYRFLKSAKVPYVGSDPKGAKIAFNKILFKRYCDERRIPTPAWKIVKNAKQVRAFGLPCVLKAANGGSSKEVMLVRSEKDLNSAAAKKLFRLKDKFYVEKLIEGVEITIGVLKNKALPVIEIVTPENGWFDYKNKYSGTSREIPFAPSVSKKIQSKAQKIALNIHRELMLGNYSRTDVIVKDDIPCVLEVNTPGGVGLTPMSLFPRAAEASGMDFNHLVETFLKK